MPAIKKSATTTTVAVDAQTAWKVVAEDFLEISRWARGVKSSEANEATPEGVNGSTYGGRVCDVAGIGRTEERIIAYDSDNRSLTYRITAEGLPAFVAEMSNTWTVTPNPAGSSDVTVDLRARTKGIVGSIAAFPLGRVLAKAAARLPKDLKAHLEDSSQQAV